MPPGPKDGHKRPHNAKQGPLRFWGAPDREEGGLLALTDHWIFLVLLNRSSPLCRHLPCGGGFYLFPFVLFMYFPSISWGGMSPGDGERRRVQNEIRVAGLPYASVRSILIPFDPPDKSALRQHCDGLPCRVLRTPTARRNGFHRRPAVSLLPRTADQKAVDCKLDWR